MGGSVQRRRGAGLLKDAWGPPIQERFRYFSQGKPCERKMGNCVSDTEKKKVLFVCLLSEGGN